MLPVPPCSFFVLHVRPRIPFFYDPFFGVTAVLKMAHWVSLGTRARSEGKARRLGGEERDDVLRYIVHEYECMLG